MTACALTSVVFLTHFTAGSFEEQVKDEAMEAPWVTVVPEDEGKTALPEVPTGEEEAPEPEAPLETAPQEPPPEAPVLMASAHFAMEEYRCDCQGYCDGWPVAMNVELLEKIEALRCYFDRPIIITSGVRCERRNEEVGGIRWSFHKRGCAADLYCPGIGVGDLALAAKELGLNVLPYYGQGYVHVEV